MDPVAGGNANAYVYPGDPVNNQDVTGDMAKVNAAWFRQLHEQELRRMNAEAVKKSEGLKPVSRWNLGVNMNETKPVGEREVYAKTKDGPPVPLGRSVNEYNELFPRGFEPEGVDIF